MLDSIGLNVLEKYKDFVDLWLCVNKWSYELVKAKEWKCYYLPYPVDTSYFESEDTKYGKRLWGCNLHFLHNAGYCDFPRKGTDLVLKAVLLLKTKIPHASLTVNSQVPLGVREKNRLLFEQWEVTMNELYGKVRSWDWNKDINIIVSNVKESCDLYKEGDIYLAPSRKEGLGLPIYEAMACGFPVITTDAPPMNEVVTDERLLVKTKNNVPDLNDLVSKMEFAASMNLSDVSRKNRKIIEEGFSWNVLKLEYLKVFQEVVDGREF